VNGGFNNCLTVSVVTQIYYARLIALFSPMIGWMNDGFNNCLTVSAAAQISYARLIALFSPMIGWFWLVSKITDIDWIRIENRHT